MIRRCEASVFRRDTYRRTGAGPHGFTLHYVKGQCKRRARANGYCWQHHYFAPEAEGSSGTETPGLIPLGRVA